AHPGKKLFIVGRKCAVAQLRERPYRFAQVGAVAIRGGGEDRPRVPRGPAAGIKDPRGEQISAEEEGEEHPRPEQLLTSGAGAGTAPPRRPGRWLAAGLPPQVGTGELGLIGQVQLRRGLGLGTLGEFTRAGAPPGIVL